MKTFWVVSDEQGLYLYSVYVFYCSKSDPGLLVRVVPMLSYMMEDSNSSVIKRVMTAFMQLYMMAFMVCDKQCAMFRFYMCELVF